MAPITARELNRATLARQGLLEPIRARSVAAAIEQLGSLQAQHPEWPPIALAGRTTDARSGDLSEALARRTVVRSSLMRLTIHVVTARDLWPMFAVCQPLRLTQWRLLMKADPVTSQLGRKMTAAHRVAIEALRTEPLSSLELDRLMTAEIGPEAADDARTVVRAAWRHFAAFVPLIHVPHQGEGYGRSKYAIATDWIGQERPELDPERARTHLARRYLSAFGPASVEDLVAYVGRGEGGIRPWREAVAAIGDELVTLSDESGRTLHDMADAPRPGGDLPAPPRLLARWDSVLLSHAPKHRGRIIAEEHRSAVFSKNADVLPTFLIDGMVAGTWLLTRAAGAPVIRLRSFGRLGRTAMTALESEAQRVLKSLAPDATTHEIVFER